MKCGTLETAAELEFMPGIESKPQIRKVMSQMEPELFDDLLNIKLCLAKEAAKDKDSKSVAVRQLERICALRDEIRADGDCISLKMLAVTGNDLIKAGMKPGKEVGQDIASFSGTGFGRAGEEQQRIPSWNVKSIKQLIDLQNSTEYIYR